MIKKLLLVMFLLSLGLAWTAGCGGLPKSAVASVDGKVITREDLDKAIEDLKAQYGESLPKSDSPQYAELQKQVAARLVNEEILWFKADNMNIDVTDDEVNAQIDQFKQQSGGEEGLNQQLEKNNMTLDRLKDQVHKSLLFQKLYAEVTKDAPPVTDEQALKYYNENQSQFQKPETRHVLHILVKDEATANQVKARLDAGEDFGTLAKELSQDPGSKDKGGDLGDVPSKDSGMVAEFEQGMDALAAGQTSGPVKSSFGYHIIRVMEIKPPGTQAFAEVKENLKQGLATENQRTVFDKWFEEVKKQYEDQIEYAEEFRPTPTTPTTATTATTATTETTATQAQPASAP